MDEPHNEEAVDEIDLFEYFQIFWKRKWGGLLIINCVVIVTLIQILWLADEVYEAQATIMPLKSSSGGTISALRNMVPTGLAPFPLSQGEENLNRFTNILQSRTIAEAIVRHLDLINLLYPDVPPKEHPTLQRVVQTVRQKLIRATAYNKKGLVRFAVQAHSAQLAADIANAYVQHLQRYLRENTTTESRRNRVFIEDQYEKASRDLERAEQHLQAFQEKYKLFSLSAQTEQIIASLGTLKGSLMAKEVELNIRRRSGVSRTNPQYMALIYEIDELRQKIAELEKGTGNSSGFESVALEALPGLQKQFAQLMRDRAMQEALSIYLAQQVKQAGIVEENDAISFLPLDSAIPSLLRIKPNRKLNLLLGGMLGVMFAVAYVILQTLLEKYRGRQHKN